MVDSISIQQARRQLASLIVQDQSKRGVAETVAELQLLLGTVGGFVPSGIWDEGTAYTGDEVVAFEGSVYAAIAASTGVEPGTDDTKWVVLVAKGDPGPQGIPGVDLVNAGDWDDATDYTVNQLVWHNGAIWVALAANDDSEPDAENSDWELLVGPGPQSWGGEIKSPEVRTYVLERAAVRPGVINSLTIETESGSLTCSVTINGTECTGIDSVAGNNSEDVYAATAANAFAVGDTIGFKVEAISTPVWASLTVKWTPTG